MTLSTNLPIVTTKGPIMSHTILVVDDDPHIRDVVVFALENAGMKTQEASDGKQALDTISRNSFDLIVLDINMPEMDGLEVCKTLRKKKDIPILFLSSRDEEIDRIIGLEIGADDYLTKPFSTRELVARVKAILKRTIRQSDQAKKQNSTTIYCGALKIDTKRHEATWENQEIPLTATEFSILLGMASQPNRVFNRNQIMTMAYGPSICVSDRTIDSHIRHIRSKLVQKGCKTLLTTLRGVGYKLTP